MRERHTIISKHTLSTKTIGTESDQIGEDIPDDMERCVIGLIFNTGTANSLEITLGDSSDNDAEVLAIIEAAANVANSLGSFDVDKPLFVCRPEVAAGGSTVTKNRLGIAHESNAFNTTFVYFDRRAV